MSSHVWKMSHATLIRIRPSPQSRLANLWPGFVFECSTGASARHPDTCCLGCTQRDQDRPILRRGDNPAPKADEVVSTINVPIQIASTGPEIAPGLALPSTGRIWALDTLEG